MAYALQATILPHMVAAARENKQAVVRRSAAKALQSVVEGVERVPALSPAFHSEFGGQIRLALAALCADSDHECKAVGTATSSVLSKLGSGDGAEVMDVE